MIERAMMLPERYHSDDKSDEDWEEEQTILLNIANGLYKFGNNFGLLSNLYSELVSQKIEKCQMDSKILIDYGLLYTQ